MDLNPLTFLQQRFVDRASADAFAGAGKLWISLDIVGELDVKALISAIGELVARHDALRIRFVRDAAGTLSQYARDADDEQPAITLQQVSCETEQQFLDHVVAAATAECEREDDLTSQPPARFFVFRLDPARHVFLAVFSRHVMDGRSRAIFVRELWEVYHAVHATGLVPGRPERPDFLAAVRRLAALNAHRAAIKNSEYWRRRLAPDPLFEAIGKARTGDGDGASVVHTVELDRPSMARIATEAAGLRCTEFEVVFSRVASTLADELGLERLVFMVLNDFRTVADRDVIGSFVGGLPIVLDRDESGSISAAQIQRAVLRARVHGYTPSDVMNACFDRLAREAGVHMRHAIGLSYLERALTAGAQGDPPIEVRRGPGVPLEFLSAPLLDILIDADDDDMFITVIFNAGAFAPAAVDRITDALTAVLGGRPAAV